MTNPQKWSVLQRTYRQLRLHGESETFLRHCVSVHDAAKCTQYAAIMLRHHRRLEEIREARAALPVYRVDRKVALWAGRRRVRWGLYRCRARLRVLNFVSDFFVVLTLLGIAWGIVSVFNIVRVALFKSRRLDLMTEQLLTAVWNLEHAEGCEDPRA
eukprot:CAMPEP_0174846150 /NCGR_PEP_ID=MMETSP1114-20130205/12156_1 /TAXON_ID=312471 /ORGANISM="Neobodo designis, Strain CCAP 1951/1" /LENGTH=156 /DNA_ID=CAMNT_0016080413 /DNA_START=65 /DNA_END=531 /DNA_ORIENTATION=-